jgi:hypothetical protein
VSISNGAEPDTNKRIDLAAAALRPGSASSRTYKVGTPIKTVARGSLANDPVRVEAGTPEHLAAIEQGTMNRHKQAVDMKNRQRRGSAHRPPALRLRQPQIVLEDAARC